MEIKTKVYSLELTPQEIKLLEEELFNLHLWDKDRNSPLNKHKIREGDFPKLDELFKKIKLQGF